MKNLNKLEFMTIDITSKNDLSWIFDVKIHLDIIGLEDTIKDGNKTSSKKKDHDILMLSSS